MCHLHLLPLSFVTRRLSRVCQICENIIFGMCLQPDPGRRSTFLDIAAALQRVQGAVRSSSGGVPPRVVNSGNHSSAWSTSLADGDYVSVVNELDLGLGAGSGEESSAAPFTD